MVPLCAAAVRDREGIVSDASEHRVGSHKKGISSLGSVCGIVRGSYPCRDAGVRDRWGDRECASSGSRGIVRGS